ncbi:hypothetical protein HDU96_004293 [Phlyctochytrium bullatum]|nr:hypothetical protein HDU96_004293 [Phlyctochytrium bullatum]
MSDNGSSSAPSTPLPNSSSSADAADPADTAKNLRWTNEQVRRMLEVLWEQIQRGKRSDTGYKSEAWKAIVAVLEAEFPPLRFESAKVKAKFNCERKRWMVFKTIRDNSGFGIDPTTGIVTATTAVWDDLIAKNPEAKAFRYKPLENLDLLDLILTGVVAKGALSALTGKELIAAGEDGPVEEEADEQGGGEAVAVGHSNVEKAKDVAAVEDRAEAAPAVGGARGGDQNPWGEDSSDEENRDPQKGKGKAVALKPPAKRRSEGSVAGTPKVKRKHQRPTSVPESKVEQSLDNLTGVLEALVQNRGPAAPAPKRYKTGLELLAENIRDLLGLQYLDTNGKQQVVTSADCKAFMAAFRGRPHGDVTFDFCMINVRDPLDQLDYIQTFVLPQRPTTGLIDLDASKARMDNAP